MSLGGCVTEDEGTIVSLDRNSSSSSCHCASTVTYEQGLSLTQSMLGKASTVVSLDRCSNRGNDAATLLVSLDWTDCSTAGCGEHCTRPSYQDSQRTLVANLEDLGGSRDNNRGDCSASNHSCNSCTPSGSVFSSSSAMHISHNDPNALQKAVLLNLDSKIDIFNPNPFHARSHSPRTSYTTREDHHILNRHSYNSLVPPHSLPHLHPPSSPKLVLPQQLQNIMELRESECFNSSDNKHKQGDVAITKHCDGHRVHVVSSQEQLTQPGVLLKAAVNSDIDTFTATDKVRMGKRKRVHKNTCKKNGASGVALMESRGGSDVKVIKKRERVTTGHDEKELKVISSSEAMPASLRDCSVHVNDNTALPLPQNSYTLYDCSLSQYLTLVRSSL